MIRRLFAALLLLAVSASLAWPARTQASEAPSGFTAVQRAEIVELVRAAMKADPSILRDAIGALQADESNVKQAAARAALEKAGPALSQNQSDPVAGNASGDVTVVEFYDLRCPYCRRMLPVMAELLHNDPKIRLVYKDIPILGPASTLGARAVLAAQKQDGYLRLHDAIMSGPQNITEDSLRDAAARTGLDWVRLRHDMADPSIQARIDANLQIAQSLGIDGTPVYVVGGKMLPGAVDLAELQSAVAAARNP